MDVAVRESLKFAIQANTHLCQIIKDVINYNEIYSIDQPIKLSIKLTDGSERILTKKDIDMLTKEVMNMTFALSSRPIENFDIIVVL